MSLNNIELQDFILAELYKDNLVAGSSVVPARTIPRPAPPAATSAPSPSTSAAPAQPAAATTIPAPSAAPSTPAASAAPIPEPAASSITSAPAPASPGYKFLGNNRRKITILVQSPGKAFLPDDQLTFLTKILEACQMNIGDVAIVNHASVPVVVTDLRRQLQPSIILLFGLDPVAIKLPIQFPVFKQQAYDQCTYVSAPALEELVQPTQEGKLLKSKLWVTLKTLFNV